MRSRLTFIATVGALGTLFAASPWSQSPDTGTRPAGKKVHRRAGSRAAQNTTPLFNEAVWSGNLLFIAGKGAGRDSRGTSPRTPSRRWTGSRRR